MQTGVSLFKVFNLCIKNIAKYATCVVVVFVCMHLITELQRVHVLSSPSRVKILHVSAVESEYEFYWAGLESKSEDSSRQLCLIIEPF